MDVSVIIPTYQMAAELEQSLRFLTAQRAGCRFEVVVSDDGSSDPTREVVTRFQDRLDLQYVHRPRDAGSGRARARNLGLDAARGSLVTFIDSGVVVPSDFIAATWEASQRTPSVALVHEVLGMHAEAQLAGAPLDPDHLHDAIDRLGDDEVWIDHRRGLWSLVDRDLSKLPAPWALGWTCALTVSRADAVAVGGFDVRFRGWGAEDLDLCYRLHRRGVRFRVPPRAVALHLPHPRRSSEEREATHQANRLLLHGRDHALETEIAALHGGFRCNIVAQRLELLSLEHALPYRPAAAWQDIAAATGGPDRLCVVGLDRAETARALGARHALVPSRAAAHDLQRRLPDVRVEPSIACFTRHADGAFAAVVITDAIRLFTADHQRQLIRECGRIAHRAVLALSPRDVTPLHAFRARYRAASGWPWASCDEIAAVAGGLGKSMVPIATRDDTTLFQIVNA